MLLARPSFRPRGGRPPLDRRLSSLTWTTLRTVTRRDHEAAVRTSRHGPWPADKLSSQKQTRRCVRGPVSGGLAGPEMSSVAAGDSVWVQVCELAEA